MPESYSDCYARIIMNKTSENPVKTNDHNGKRVNMAPGHKLGAKTKEKTLIVLY